MGLLFALAVVLSALEGMLPVFIPVPGIKLGLSNVVTMYAVFVLGPRQAFTLAALKSLSAVLTRGFTAGLLSLSGGMLSVAVMTVLLAIGGGRVSYGVISMAGAIAHNLGQLGVVSLLLRLPAIWYYLPVLVAAGLIAGLLTSLLTRVFLPRLAATGQGDSPA